MRKQHIDPEFERWKRKYPKFPGTAKCVDLLAAPGTQSSWKDIICSELEAQARKDPSELIGAVQDPKNASVRKILLWVLVEIAAPEAIEVFTQILEAGDKEERDCAVMGLQQIDTKEARRVLWRNGAS